MDATRAQASVEYVVVIALVVVVCAVGYAQGAPAIANAVVRQARRALCVVGGGDCLASERRPCVVASRSTDERVAVDVVLVRVGRHAGVLRQDLSDGSSTVTEIDDLEGGVQAGLGAHGRLALAGLDLEGGGELQAQALARLGGSRTFHVRDSGAADALVRRLIHGSPATMVYDLPLRLAKKLVGSGDGLPRADEVAFEGGAKALGSVELGDLAGSADLHAALAASLGGRFDRRNGRRTFYIAAEGELGAKLRAAIAGADANTTPKLGVALTFDRAGQMLELTVATAASGGARLAALAGTSRLGAGAAARTELEAKLDLTVADNAAAVRRLFTGLRLFGPHAGVAVDAARDVAARLARDGRLDVRAYRTASSSAGVGADVALGVKLGADVRLEHAGSHLLSAWSRPAGGVWERRVDCQRR